MPEVVDCVRGGIHVPGRRIDLGQPVILRVVDKSVRRGRGELKHQPLAGVADNETLVIDVEGEAYFATDDLRQVLDTAALVVKDEGTGPTLPVGIIVGPIGPSDDVVVIVDGLAPPRPPSRGNWLDHLRRIRLHPEDGLLVGSVVFVGATGRLTV